MAKVRAHKKEVSESSTGGKRCGASVESARKRVRARQSSECEEKDMGDMGEEKDIGNVGDMETICTVRTVPETVSISTSGHSSCEFVCELKDNESDDDAVTNGKTHEVLSYFG